MFVVNDYLCPVLKGFRYRLYPTKQQAELLNKHVGACRFIYNLALEVKNQAYTSHRKNLTCFDLISQLPELKKECEWLREIDSQALQQSIINLDRAFTAFFKGSAKYPNFKNKKKGVQSFRNPHGSRVKIDNSKLYQPKFLDGIKIVQDRPCNGEIKSTTISRTPTGKYFVSILVETGAVIPKKRVLKEDSAIGIDLGLKHFIVTSEGIKVDNPKYLQKALLHLKYLQRQISKKTKGSNNRKKAIFRVALQYEKVANQRRDFLHKLSSQLIENHDTLCLEDLNIKGMVRNHKLAQSIHSAAWGMFVDMCKYKAEWKGKNILQIPTFQPSTKICSDCGTTNHTLTLSDREWVCLNCGVLHDRDINAAINIKNYSLKNCVGIQRGKCEELPTLVGALNHEVTTSLK